MSFGTVFAGRFKGGKRGKNDVTWGRARTSLGKKNNAVNVGGKTSKGGHSWNLVGGGQGVGKGRQKSGTTAVNSARETKNVFIHSVVAWLFT